MTAGRGERRALQRRARGVVAAAWLCCGGLPALASDSPQTNGVADRVTVEANLTGVMQHAGASGSDDGQARSRGSYRGEIAATLPLAGPAGAGSKLYAQLRFGQGIGLALRPTYTASVDTAAFETDDDHRFAILNQAWYQLSVPLGRSAPRQRIELNFGKIDPFVFFDQNAVADNEITSFLNNALVHNPLLDSGGDAGVDAHGNAPGVRLAYVDAPADDRAWGASIGVFGAGPSTTLSARPRQAFVIAQLEATRSLFAGLQGHYRLYAWRNGRASDFDDTAASHTGWGASVDQRISRDSTLFARLGHQTSGAVRFDRTLSFGLETRGSRWARAEDAIGLGLALMRTSAAWRSATANGALVGYAAAGTERVAELYYRYRANPHLELSPDLQWIQRPGGDGRAASITVLGVRANLGF